MNQEKLHRFHCENVRAVDSGLECVARSLRDAVASNDLTAIATYLRLYFLLVATCGECRLAKLLYEPAFSDGDRKRFREVPAHLDRWKLLVEDAFRKHYNVPYAVLSKTTLPHSAYYRYVALGDLLSSELSGIITLRNKLAHGQWVYPFAEDGEKIAQAQMDALRTENALSIQLKHNLIVCLLEVIHFLRVSKKTFERDFDDAFRRIEQLRQQLTSKSYDHYAEILRARLARGKKARRKAESEQPG